MYKLLIALIIIGGCLAGEEQPRVKKDGADKSSPNSKTITIIGTEELGDFGKIKNLTLLSKEIKKPGEEYSIYQATYVWGGVKYRTGSLNRAYPDNKSEIPLHPPIPHGSGAQYQRAFEWIKENTPEDAVFLSWWDYGDLIRVFSEREAIVSDPCNSKKCAETLSEDETDVFRYEDPERFSDMLTFFTRGEDEAHSIAKKYGVDYVFVTYEEFPKSAAISYLAGTQLPIKGFQFPLSGDAEQDAQIILEGLRVYNVGAYFFKNLGDIHVTWYLQSEDVPKVKDQILLSLLPFKILPGNDATRELLENFELVYAGEEEYIYIYKVK